eukprot:TRINITY_DN41870_c0_g1_i1.p1 TRINITY_DN41870_c0_g1~~TRINITY_DN41870_c0_g1_i1.p1  ORF type:complete len:266 (+),score=50.31 TRINITY_DN41870_c0_g1_i1:226-1023(+)
MAQSLSSSSEGDGSMRRPASAAGVADSGSSTSGRRSSDESSTSEGSSISELVQLRCSTIRGAVGVLQEHMVECRRAGVQISSDSPWAPFEVPASSSGGSSGAAANEMKDFLWLLLQGIDPVATHLDCIIASQIAVLVKAFHVLLVHQAPFTEASWKPLTAIAMVTSLRALLTHPGVAVSERNMKRAVEGWWTLLQFETARRVFEGLTTTTPLTRDGHRELCESLQEIGSMCTSEGYIPGTPQTDSVVSRLRRAANNYQRTTKLSL